MKDKDKDNKEGAVELPSREELKSEKEELDKKIEDLNGLLTRAAAQSAVTPHKPNVTGMGDPAQVQSSQQIALLQRQSSIMQQLSNNLGEQIAFFGAEEKAEDKNGKKDKEDKDKDKDTHGHSHSSSSSSKSKPPHDY